MVGITPTLDEATQRVAVAFPHRRVSNCETLTGGLINTNLKITFDSGEAPVVLRIYRDGADVCRKESQGLRLVRQTLPGPEVIHAQPEGMGDCTAFSFLEYIEGITFQQLKRTNDLRAIQQAAYSVGQTLAAIGSYQFSKPGRLIVDDSSNGLSVGAPYVEAPNSVPRILDMFLESKILERRVGAEFIDRLRTFVWSWAPRLLKIDDECNLVHSDFGNRNILVREVNGKWIVAAVLDWEFAFSGSLLLDVGHFLRYERDARPLREPYFSRAFVEHGGTLPDDWRQIVRLVDLTSLVECLTHNHLPADVEAELLYLVQATFVNADPL